jgi:hypothetical protein
MIFQCADWLHISILFLQASVAFCLKLMGNFKSCFTKNYFRVVILYETYTFLRELLLKRTSNKNLKYEVGLSGTRGVGGCFPEGFVIFGTG